MYSQPTIRRAITTIKVVLSAMFVATTIGLTAPAGVAATVAHVATIGHGATPHHPAQHHPAPHHPAPHHPTAPGKPVPGKLVVQGGYWVVNRSGGVGAAGGAPTLGGLDQQVKLADPVVGMASTPNGRGYWLVTSGGNVFHFGDAGFFGRATPSQVHQDGQVVAVAATRNGGGYWLATSRGKVLPFGDAGRFGGLDEAQYANEAGPVTSITATPQGGGYWLVSAGGYVSCFGDARCYGTSGGPLPSVVGLAPAPGGNGYWLATTTGDVFGYGDAHPQGSAPATGATPVVGIAAQANGDGYWLANARGSTYGFGAAAGTRATDLADKAVAIVPDPTSVAPAPAVHAGPGAQLARSATSGASAPGGLAVKFALAQVGKPYIYGDTGPGGYDCSGLALASWRAAGVDLPRTSAEQYYAGAHVPLSQVQPGDLIFWASDPADPATIYHVAISLGGDETVQATHTGSTVMVMPIWSQDLVPEATVP